MNRALLAALLAACAGETPSSPDGPRAVDALLGTDARQGTPDARTAAPDARAGTPDGGRGPAALVHFIGRFDMTDPNAPRFAWSGSTVMARFTGTGVSVRLADAGANQFAIYVDGVVASKVMKTSGDQSYPLATGLAAGTHDIAIVKRTEAFQGDVTFKGLTPTGGALVTTPEPFGRMIEVIGDSITAGYGDEGAGPNCGFTPDTENEDVAYPALTARALGAGYDAPAWSGIGMYRSNSGGTTDQMPTLYLRTLPDQPTSTVDFAREPPDVIVVNLGTNDFAQGDPGQPFVDAYVAFLATLRAHHPGVPILATVSPMMDGTSRTQEAAHIDAAVKARHDSGDALVTSLAQSMVFATQDGSSDGLGCDYHPSRATHAKMATALTAAIKAAKGW